MKGKKLSVLSLLAVSAMILTSCSSSNDASGVKIEVPDIPMHESMAISKVN